MKMGKKNWKQIMQDPHMTIVNYYPLTLFKKKIASLFKLEIQYRLNSRFTK